MSTRPITGQKRLSIVLLIVAAALAALLVYEWQQATALRDSVLALKTRQAATAPALKLEPPFRLQPPSSYARITEQPLFVASRKPSEQATVAVGPPVQFELTGIAQTPGESVILLRNAKTGKTERLKSGEKTKNGLELETVKPDGVTLKQNGQNVALDLQVVVSGNRTMPAVPPATAATPRPASAPAAASQPPQGAAASANAKEKNTPPAVDPGLQQLNLQRAKNGLPPCTPDGSCPK